MNFKSVRCSFFFCFVFDLPVFYKLFEFWLQCQMIFGWFVTFNHKRGFVKWDCVKSERNFSSSNIFFLNISCVMANKIIMSVFCMINATFDSKESLLLSWRLWQNLTSWFNFLSFGDNGYRLLYIFFFKLILTKM